MPRRPCARRCRTSSCSARSATAAEGSAGRHGPLWGARADAWGENEERQLPSYQEAIRRAGIGPGTSVLDVGCGSGVFLRTAAAHGARVAGLDASEELAALARRRVPEADVRVGDMQFLPYEDDSFDAVTGFNTFFFADDMIAALREAGRVARPGAPVVIQVWGRPERCYLTAMLRAIAPLRAEPPPGGSGPPELYGPGVLEGTAREAGLTPEGAYDLVYAAEYRDEETMLRLLLAPGATVSAVNHSGEEAVRRAILEALAPFRTPDGGYRLENEWHDLLARA